jgi:Integrase core domain
MTDNGSAYRSKSFRVALTAAGARRKRTRPYTPRTNGKAEPFIQTNLRGWAYAQPYASSQERSGALMPWLRHYNTVRPHTGLVQCPPAVRLKSQLLGSTKGTVASSRTAPHDDRRRRSGRPAESRGARRASARHSTKEWVVAKHRAQAAQQRVDNHSPRAPGPFGACRTRDLQHPRFDAAAAVAPIRWWICLTTSGPSATPNLVHQ